MQLGTNAAKAPINPGTYNDILNIVGNAPNFSIDGQWYSMNVLPDPMSPKNSIDISFHPTVPITDERELLGIVTQRLSGLLTGPVVLQIDHE